MARERLRGCGYRKVGGVYLVGGGIPVVCDGLPFEVKECNCCGFEPPFFRGFKWISKEYINMCIHESHDLNEVINTQHAWKCNCYTKCPVCYPYNNDLEKYGMMWVGERYYTPHTFIKEAENMDVCKRINKIPKDLVLGKTWIILAYKKYKFFNGPKFGPLESEPEEKPAIFYAFIPQRIELLIWKSQATESYIKQLKKKGITPIIIEDGDKDHE